MGFQESRRTNGMAKFDKELGEEELKSLRVMSEHGLNQRSMAAILGISRTTLQRMMKHRPAVREAVEYGKARGVAKVANKAFELALSGKNPAFTAFWLKVNAGWRETTHIEISRGGDEVPVTEMDREQRQARIKQLLDLQKRLEGDSDVIDVTPEQVDEDG